MNRTLSSGHYRIESYNSSKIVIQTKTGLGDAEVMESLKEEGIVSSIQTYNTNYCSTTTTILKWNWVGNRYDEYNCVGSIYGGNISCGKSYCTSTVVSLSIGASIFKKTFEAALGFEHSQETCTQVSFSCTKGTDKQYSKLFIRTSKQDFNNHVRELRICTLHGGYDRTSYVSGTVVWGSYFQCHYETNTNENCPTQAKDFCDY